MVVRSLQEPTHPEHRVACSGRPFAGTTSGSGVEEPPLHLFMPEYCLLAASLSDLSRGGSPRPHREFEAALLAAMVASTLMMAPLPLLEKEDAQDGCVPPVFLLISLTEFVVLVPCSCGVLRLLGPHLCCYAKLRQVTMAGSSELVLRKLDTVELFQCQMAPLY